MRRIRIRLAAVGGTACAVLALASVAQGAASVPFKGGFHSTCTSSGVACGTFAGHGTVAGRFKGVITGVVAPGTGACPGAATTCNTSTVTAANGDQYFTFSIIYVTGFDSSTGLLTYVLTTDVTGGTGRFANATGTDAAFGEVSADQSYYYASFSGTITP